MLHHVVSVLHHAVSVLHHVVSVLHHIMSVLYHMTHLQYEWRLGLQRSLYYVVYLVVSVQCSDRTTWAFLL